MSHVESRMHDRIAIVVFSNPPVNALSHAVRSELAAAVSAAIANPNVRAIVLGGNDHFFSAGADITEFGTAAKSRPPSLHDLIDIVENSSKPVIAAIEGTCLGGGFELALSCHHRIAAAGARFALPEIKLGIIPGAGGTQRLPRLAGAEKAMHLILTGEIVAAAWFEATHVLDEICASDAVAAAMAWVQTGNTHTPPARVSDISFRDPKFADASERTRRTIEAASYVDPAALGAIAAIEAAVLPFSEGARKEREAFLTLIDSPQSKALRHAFFAERAAARVPDLSPQTPLRPIHSAAVVGAGTMGTGIAMSLLNAGIPVLLLEANAEAASRGVAKIRKTYESSLSKGKLTEDEVVKRMGSLQIASDYQALASVDLAIEAVYEEREVKQKVFASLDAVLRNGAILASNTSTLNLDLLAAGTSRPGAVIGLHFFSPAHVMKLLEIVRGKETAPDVLATALSLAKRMRKVGVVAGVCDGFIGNRMIEQYMRQALFMLDEGASPREVDEAIQSFGFAMGPFRMMDLAGNDIGWAIRKRRYVEYPDMKYSKIADRLCELGRMGEKTQAGWYDYRPGKRDALDSPVVARMLEDYRSQIHIRPRAISREEIIDRLLYALANEGAAMLEEGIAQRASDIDVVYLNGYGFPRWRGGPMFHADQVGLPEVLARMKAFAANPHGDPAFWTPAPLLARLAAEGKSVLKP